MQYTVAEVKNGTTVAYPDAGINTFNAGDNPADKLVSVQSVVVNPTGKRLWILDTGSTNFGPPIPGGPKLIGVDLATNKIVKKIAFPADVALPTTYLNDVRFDLRRGREGMAFITDSSATGGIIVVDLASGRSWRRLSDHPSTRPDPAFLGIVEGQPMLLRIPGAPPQRPMIGSDGIAISGDGRTRVLLLAQRPAFVQRQRRCARRPHESGGGSCRYGQRPRREGRRLRWLRVRSGRTRLPRRL